jgi:hypothetical protein
MSKVGRKKLIRENKHYCVTIPGNLQIIVDSVSEIGFEGVNAVNFIILEGMKKIMEDQKITENLLLRAPKVRESF